MFGYNKQCVENETHTHPQLKKMNKTHFEFYLIRFSGEKPVFLVAISPFSGEFWLKKDIFGVNPG